MKKIPLNELKIGYSDFRIVPVDKEYSDENMFDGITDFEKQIIKYKSTLQPNDLVSTILHELFHTINFHFGMKHTQGKQIEEQFVDCLSNGLTTVIRDNPNFLDWIKQNIKR